MRTKLEEAAYRYRKASNRVSQAKAAKEEKIVAALTLLGEAGYQEDHISGQVARYRYEVRSRSYDKELDESISALLNQALKEVD